jgi:large subunit ribosomal protein L10
MPKTRSTKESLLQGYKDVLSNNGGFIAVNIDKVNNLTVTKLKRELGSIGSKVVVVKNTVFKIALQDANTPIETQNFDGQTAVITYKDDASVVAKALKSVRGDAKILSPRYAYVDKGYYSAEQATTLESLPSRNELLAMMLGSLNAPLTGFMNAVTGNARSFVRALSAVQAKK